MPTVQPTTTPCEADAADIAGTDPDCGFARQAPTLHAVCLDRDGRPVTAGKSCWRWARSQLHGVDASAGMDAFRSGTCESCGALDAVHTDGAMACDAKTPGGCFARRRLAHAFDVAWAEAVRSDAFLVALADLAAWRKAS